MDPPGFLVRLNTRHNHPTRRSKRPPARSLPATLMAGLYCLHGRIAIRLGVRPHGLEVNPGLRRKQRICVAAAGDRRPAAEW